MSFSKITITVREEQTGEPINYSNPAGVNSPDCLDVEMKEVLDRVVRDVDGGLHGNTNWDRSRHRHHQNKAEQEATRWLSSTYALEALEYELAAVAHTIAASHSKTTFSTDKLTSDKPSTHIDLPEPAGWAKEPHKPYAWEAEKMVAPSSPTLQQKLRAKLKIKHLVRLPGVCISRLVVAAAFVDKSLENTDLAAVEAAAAVAADAAADNKED